MKRKLTRRNKQWLTVMYRKSIYHDIPLASAIEIQKGLNCSAMNDRHIRRFGWTSEPNHPARKELPWGTAIPMVSGKGRVVGFTVDYDATKIAG